MRFATPEVAICTEKLVISALGVGIVCNGERLEYLLEYFVHHLSVHWPLLMQPHLRNIGFLH
jgi:hypothetical protein